MNDHRKRLVRLEQLMTVRPPSDPARERIAFGRAFVIDHGGDPPLLDRWLAQEFVETDLRNYTILHDAAAETWAHFGEDLPVDGLMLRSDDAVRLTIDSANAACQCDEHFGPGCDLAGQWPGRPNETTHRYHEWHWQQIFALIEQQDTRR